MKRLKELRVEANYTQERLAEMLRTTQQTIARWESGKAKPSIAALRDLAVIYGTSVDDLLGDNPLSSSKAVVSNALFTYGDSDRERFWGHLGVRFPSQPKSTWYPITLAETEKLDSFFANVDADNPWVAVRTLNNRFLLLNALAVPRLVLLDDRADQPHDDWDLPWDGYAGFPQEVYKALSNWFTDSVHEDSEEYSETFVKTIENTIEENQLDEDVIMERVDSTVVIRRDGVVERLLSDGLWDLVSMTETDDIPAIFHLRADYGEIDLYFPSNGICAIDMPLHTVIEEASRKQTDGDDEHQDEI